MRRARLHALAPRLFACLLWAAPVGYCVYLASHEAQWRQTLTSRVPAPAAPEQAPPAKIDFKPAAIATVMGLGEQVAAIQSTEPLTLRACFVSSTGASRALLAGPEGERLYQVGDNLPGGSVLRRIEASRAVLWRKGREELLVLSPSSSPPILQPSSLPRATSALFHLRPNADLSKGH